MNLNNVKLTNITDTAFAGFNDNEIEQHWNNIIGKKVLEDNETVRLVIMPLPNSNIAKRANIITGGWADKDQIKSCDDLIRRLRTIQADDIPGSVGFALSAGVYTYVPNVSPGYKQLKYIQNMIIDVDAHVNSNTKDRFNLTIIDPKYIKYAALTVLNYINENLKLSGLPVIVPAYTSVTGGGFQFGVRFAEPLDADSAKRVFETYGSILGFNFSASDVNSSNEERKAKAIEEQAKEAKILESMSAVAFNSDQSAQASSSGSNDPKEKLGTLDNYAHKKKKGINVIVKSDMTGEWFMPFLELDNSFKDCTHAQRIPGTINQKYDAFAYIDNDLITGNDLDGFLDEITESVYDSVIWDSTTKEQLVKSNRSLNRGLRQDILNSNPNALYTKQDGYAVKSLSTIIQVANSTQREIGAGHLSTTAVENQVLKHFHNESSEIETQRLVKDVLMDLGIQIMKDSSTYIACRSPFRQDNKPSLAVYLNHGYAHVKDFTEEKSYNLITLWMAINNCSKSEAIEQMSYKYGITIDRSVKKEFEKIQTSENVLELIQQVNTTDFIYYRKANKIVDCVWKNLKNSSYETFNGYKILADHVLVNQLGVKHPEKAFKEQFQEAFAERILIDAFERFEPGADRVVVDGYVKYVNIWSASESYLKCWAEAELLSKMSLDEAIKLIKDTCPNIYIYLLQITQRGSLPYFVNWLSCLANFIYVPTIPIFPSIEGAGKNLFVQDIIDPYIGLKYRQVVNGQALMNNFNSFMGETNLIVIDEGNFTVSKEFDQLKMFTGNENVLVEKKGVDARSAPRRFNFCMFTNGADPIRHTVSDRRCNYFKLEKKLPHTLSKLGIASVPAFREAISKEVHKFWGIIIKTKREIAYEQNNLQNGQYHYQILLTHPFGKLVIKMLENDWDSIYLQLNERQKETSEEKLNMTLLKQIKDAFYNEEPLSLITINKYLDAMSWRSSVSIQEFISKNELQKNGIKIVVDSDSIKLKLDAVKLQEYIYQENNLAEIIPEYSVGKVKTLVELKKEHLDRENKIVNQSITNKPAGLNVSGMGGSIPKMQLGMAPGMDFPGGMSGLPGGLPTAPIAPTTPTVPAGIK